jgi:hypothetical protein
MLKYIKIMIIHPRQFPRVCVCVFHISFWLNIVDNIVIFAHRPIRSSVTYSWIIIEGLELPLPMIVLMCLYHDLKFWWQITAWLDSGTVNSFLVLVKVSLPHTKGISVSYTHIEYIWICSKFHLYHVLVETAPCSQNKW